MSGTLAKIAEIEAEVKGAVDAFRPALLHHLCGGAAPPVSRPRRQGLVSAPVPPAPIAPLV